MLANHGDRLRSLITHRFSLADAAAAYATAADKSTRSLKVHVNP
jgi:threonine dehydrogenase-like Zn-dependent dehydrogenase